MAVYKHRRALCMNHVIHILKHIQRNILTSGDMSLPVFLRRAYIQQNRIGRLIKLRNSAVDIRSSKQIKDSHERNLLVFLLLMLSS